MNWVRNNRFLAVYLAVLVVGIAGLSFLLYTSYQRYLQVAGDYDTQVKEMKRLQSLAPFPDAGNLARYNEVRESYAAAVADLQKQLAGFTPPLESPPPTPLQFQDRLRRVVEDVSKSAEQSGVGLPENFYLGFEQYRSAPPDTAATPGLSAELDALRDLVDILIKEHVEKLTSIKRAPLAHEAGNGGVAASEAAARPGAGRGNPAAGGAAELVTRDAVQIEFSALPSAFRETLDKIVGAPRLFVVSAMQVKNEVDKGPPRGGDEINGPNAGRPVTAPPPPQTMPGQPGAPGVDQNGVPVPPLPDKGPPPLRYVVGLEKVSVIARIELVKVAPPH